MEVRPFQPEYVLSSNKLSPDLGRARLYMKQQGLAGESRVLNSRTVRPHLYMDGLLFNALITLTTTRVAVLNEQRRPDAIVSWLRSNFLMTIQSAIRAGVDDPETLAVGMALLIGWELVSSANRPDRRLSG